MRYQSGPDGQTELHPPPGAILQCEFPPEPPAPRNAAACSELPISELAFRVLVAFRVHPHLSNVLTHISGANWTKVERSLNSIFGLATTSGSLLPLDQNIIDLMCAERGVTGRIMKPYFHAVLHKILEPNHAEQLIRHVTALFLELEWTAQQPTRATLTQSEPSSQEPGHARSEPQ